MPGLTFYYNSKISKKKHFINSLKKLRDVYKVPSLNYSENHIIEDSFLVYSCVPDFIKDDKIIKIDNYVIAMDGDFYNEDELCERLGQNKLNKLEIIYHLYKVEGKRFVKYINGEFNILIFNKHLNEIIVVNDLYGRKPFFYSTKDNIFIFSSEKKGICSFWEKQLSIDKQGLVEVFMFNHNLFGRTYIEEIRNLKPASVLQINNNKENTYKYFNWDFNYTSNNFNKKLITNEIREILENAIELRIKDKKRILLWLSGGYDSRALACAIAKEKRGLITAETFGENNSDELAIAQSLSEILGYNWSSQRVKVSYLEIAGLNSWRTEFSLPALDHPMIGNHNKMKKDADYILQGVPGLNEINSGHLRIGKILACIKPATFSSYFKIYSKAFSQLSLLFNEDYLQKYYKMVRDDFISFFETIPGLNNLYKWDVFNLTQRQPNYSHMADISDNDLFESIHPFTDIKFIPLFTQIPLKNKLFMQITKNFLYNEYPELRNIPFGNGRGLNRGNNNIINSFIYELKLNLIKPGGSNIWNKTEAFINEQKRIKSFILDNFLNNNELEEYFDLIKINKLFNNDEVMLKNIRLFDILITFLFSRNYLLDCKVEIPNEIIKNYT